MIFGKTLLSVLLALSPNDLVEIGLSNGDTIAGRLSSVQPGVLYISSPTGSVEVSLELVESAMVNDMQLSPIALEQEVDILWESMRDDLSPTGSVPNPYWAAASSVVIPGAGQRMLGQDRAANSYLFADIALLTLGGWLLLHRQDYGNAAPLLALDIVFRAYSATEAYRDSRLRSSIISGERHIGR